MTDLSEYSQQVIEKKCVTNRLPEIKKLFAQFIEDSNYVYKRCKDNIIVILEKLNDTYTNEIKKVNNSKFAKYRANKLKVLCIFNMYDLTHKLMAWSTYDYNFVYKIGEIVEIKNYDYELESMCTSGIHYFTSIDGAYYYGSNPNNYTGEWLWYTDDGSVEYCKHYVDGKPSYIESYRDGELNGYCAIYFENGNILADGHMKNNKYTGIWKYYDTNRNVILTKNFNHEKN